MATARQAGAPSGRGKRVALRLIGVASAVLVLAAVALSAAFLGVARDARRDRSAGPARGGGEAPAAERSGTDAAEPRPSPPRADAGAKANRERETSATGGPAPAHPIAAFDDGELEARLLEDPASLGPASLGTPGLGALMNAVHMPEGERWQIVEPGQAWGTSETVESIIRAIDYVHEVHGGAPPLYVGDISRKRGGYIHPHEFHQNGRDVDLGFYYSSPKRWYWKAWQSNLDVPRTWSLIKGIVTRTDVELVFCDRYVTRLLLDHAKAAGEDPAWVGRVFGWRDETKSRPLVRHVPGHRTHLHVRFYNPVAQETGRRLYPLLRKNRILPEPEQLVEHRVAPGETIKSIAGLFKTSQRAIRRVNELASDELTVGKTYLVPHRVPIEPDPDPIVVPPRTLPPG